MDDTTLIILLLVVLLYFLNKMNSSSIINIMGGAYFDKTYKIEGITDSNKRLKRFVLDCS